RKPHPGRIGFIGHYGYGRRLAITRFTPAAESLQRHVDSITYETPPLTPSAYLHRIGTFEMGLLLEGDTPKTNRQAEYALLGIPMISIPRTVRDTPDLDHSNSIQLRDWDDSHMLAGGVMRLEEIA